MAIILKQLAKANVNTTMGISITDADLEFSLTLRNGVMEFAEKFPITLK